MSLQPSQRSARVRFAISGIAPGGQGVAHLTHGGERRVVFVPRAAPGDVFEGVVDFDQRPARADALRLLEPSAARAPMPCPFAERCGGCDLMHLRRDAQHDVLRRIVGELLARATGEAAPPSTFHPAPDAVNYRTRARLAVLAGRGRAAVGYRRASSRRIEDIEACLVLDERLGVMFTLLRGLFADQSGEGEAAIALGAGGRPVLDLRWRGDLSGAFFTALERHVEGGALAGAEVWLKGAREPARLGDARGVTVAADGDPLVVPAGGFAQAHACLNAELGRAVIGLAGLGSQVMVPSRPVVELFAGSGNFTVLLARHAENVVAVEADHAATNAARTNLAARALRARVVEADADSYDLPAATRLVVLDPPRTGAAGAVRRIAGSKVRRVVYVSCDPTTLARDVETLVGAGFRLDAVDLFEMFPHTSHVETVVALERPSDKSRRSSEGPPARGPIA